MRFLVLCVLLVGCVFSVEAQSTRDAGVKPSAPVYQASKQKQKFSFKNLFKKKESNIKSGIETQKEFEARMKAVAKRKSKEARLASRPQASDQSYLGHKRPPKKRKPGKKKWCKICEFEH